jgi:hypothetical protein
LISAQPGAVIELPEGKFHIDRTLSLDARARAYLDNNYAHCHQPGGSAGYTGVDFRLTAAGDSSLGRCKPPNSAGRVGDRAYDLVPGPPEESILLYREEPVEPKIVMPQVGRNVVHEEGCSCCATGLPPCRAVAAN